MNYFNPNNSSISSNNIVITIMIMIKIIKSSTKHEAIHVDVPIKKTKNIIVQYIRLIRIKQCFLTNFVNFVHISVI